ncbi:aldehyde ferredoxin oxidoreductase family protein [Thermovorax subterraneus]|nr:aldehyde ferredoxin oxidoreductase family protein [Thermovorax subterraneus]
MYGYWNKIIRINLTNKTYSLETIKEELWRKYLGGSGLGAKLMYDEVNPGIDPLGHENKIFFLTGPFCGTNIPTSGRHAAVTKSPLTGIFAESDVGGSWGYELKRAGYDGIIIEGKAESPVYIYIEDSKIEIKDARHIWGKDTYETDELLKKELAADVEVMSIGPAGENLVKFAAIMTDGKDGRALGRCGIGAVMGAKNLKAITVKGSKNVEVYDKERLIKSIRNIAPGIKEATVNMTKFGTGGGVIGHESYGNFPLGNWKVGRWPEGAEKISGQRMAETILVGNYRCKGCIIGCGRVVKIENGPYKGVEGAGPEYETLGTLGGLCLIDELEAIAYANELCNRYGMDTITTGGVIAFAMELYEKGIITKQDTGGLDLRFGNAEAMVELVKMIAERRGIGRILAEGVRKAAKEIGGLAEEYALHVKGLEPPAHDPRAYNGVALSYATSNRGACHLAGFTHGFERVFAMPELGYDKPHDRLLVDGKAEFVAKMQNLMGVFDSLKLCKFMLQGGLKISTVVEWIKDVIGWEDYSFEELMTTGERIFNIKRMFNVKCGISRKDDILPMRFLTLKREGPGITVNLPPLGKMLSDYYEYRGWSEEGIPRESKLKELELV